ncbi:MAG: PstS family phosphate ABC transporter substrate-binding protein [Bacteroidota bacterium]
MNTYSRFIFLSLITILFSCGSDPKKPYKDTPTSGTVRIAGDETLAQLLDANADTFMGLYRYATIQVEYGPEQDCFNKLLNDSAKVILSTRKLRKDEEAYFKSRNLYPVTTRIAVDGLAIIINKENNDSLLRTDQLKAILQGKVNDWKDINSSSKLGEIRFVFDHTGSSTVRSLSDSLLNGKTEFPTNCFAVQSNPQVVDYVEQHAGAIGVIGVNWISDRDDPKQLSFSNRIRVARLSTKTEPAYPDDFFGPYQAYLFTGEYPLRRDVYLINREGRNGLGTGFASFVAGEQGQRIAKLSGLLPASPYTRDIILR